MVLVIALLYALTPNVRFARIRFLGLGSGFAVVVSTLATLAFAAYIATVGHYDRIYGWLGGGIVLLLWLYLVNLSLMVGAEVEAEVTRLGQLRQGVAAEGQVRVPLRGTRRLYALARWRERDERDGRSIRERAREDVRGG